MVYHSQRIIGIKIRVFKWIQEMIKNRIGSSSRFGFLVLRVTNQIRIIEPRSGSKNRGGQSKKRTFKKNVQSFKICENPEEFVESLDFALGLSGLFFKDTVSHLANAIYGYLSSSFGKDLNGLSNMDDEFNKIVVVMDVDMRGGRFGLGSERSADIFKFQSADLYEMLINDGDDDVEKEGEFCIQVDEFQESCVGISKKRRIDENMPMLTNDGVRNDKDGENGVNKKREIDVLTVPILSVKYTFDDPDIQEIFDTLFDFLTKRREFHNKVEVFNGKIQKFRELKSGLKIVKLEKHNIVSFESGDTCPVCFEIFEEKSVVVVTPCSHIFHRSCIFTWLSKNNTCPVCRDSCNV